MPNEVRLMSQKALQHVMLLRQTSRCRLGIWLGHILTLLSAEYIWAFKPDMR